MSERFWKGILDIANLRKDLDSTSSSVKSVQGQVNSLQEKIHLLEKQQALELAELKSHIRIQEAKLELAKDQAIALFLREISTGTINEDRLKSEFESRKKLLIDEYRNK